MQTNEENEIRIAEIDQEILLIKTTDTDMLKKKLLKVSAEAAAYSYLLHNGCITIGPKALPFIMSGDQAKIYRDRMKKFINGDKSNPEKIIALRTERGELRQNTKRTPKGGE